MVQEKEEREKQSASTIKKNDQQRLLSNKSGPKKKKEILIAQGKFRARGKRQRSGWGQESDHRLGGKWKGGRRTAMAARKKGESPLEAKKENST